MPKQPTPLRLAENWTQWLELDETVHDCVRTLCAHDEPKQITALMTLLDLMTNEKYDIRDRQCVGDEAKREAFHYTEECSAAQSAYINALVLPAAEKKIA